MARAIKQGQHIFIAFQDGEAVLDSQLRPRMYKSREQFEKSFPGWRDGKAELVEYAPTLTPPNEWVSVEERLPKYNIREDGELISSKILCYCETDKTVHLVVSQKFYTGRKGEIVHPVFRYYDEWGDEIENVSHWMPLPERPKEDE